MITHLTEDWDNAIRNCFYNYGLGMMDSGPHFGMPLKVAATYLVNDCCEIIKENKNVNIKAEFKSGIVDIAGLCVYAIFSVFDPNERVKRYHKNNNGQRLVKIKLPSYSRIFNEEPQEWYIAAMRILWEGYKDYMKENYNHI